MDSRNDPIEFSHEDQLGRASTAKVFSKALLAVPRRPMTVAVFGPWGSGKTSFANLLSGELRMAGASCVWFNPWQFTNVEAMTLAFFDMLATSLASAKDSELATTRECFYDYAETITSISLAPSVGRRSSGGRFGFGSSGRERSFLNQPSLQDQRDLLIKLYAANPKPIVVFIDDIDRLFANEIRLLIQLVKSNADFPNLKFVLLFQKETVEAALRTDGQTGADFLEKIIEVPIELPLIRSTRYVADLLRDIAEIFGELSDLNAEASDRWQRLLQRGALEPFTTLRQKNRLLDRLHLHKWNIDNGLGIDIDLVDLLGLEILRAIDYELYTVIRRHGPALTEAGDLLRAGREIDGDAKPYLDEIIAEAGDAERSLGIFILKELFPCFEAGTGRRNAEDDEREFRICRSRHFPKYFFEGLLSEEISRAGKRRLEAATKSGESIYEFLEAFEQHDLLFDGLEHLRTIAGKIPEKNWKSVACDLGRIVDSFGRGIDGAIERSVVKEAEATLMRMLVDSKPRDRAQVLIALACQKDSIQLPALILSSNGGGKEYLQDGTLRKLELKLSRDIEQAAATELLEQFEQYGRLLNCWHAWRGRAASNFVRSLASDPKRFAHFARSVAPFVRVEAGLSREPATQYTSCAEAVLKFLPRRLALQYARYALSALRGENDEDFLAGLVAELKDWGR